MSKKVLFLICFFSGFGAYSQVTNDFSPKQGYLNAAPIGIDALYSWTIPGGKGDGVKIIVIDSPLDISHEDLKKTFWVGGEVVDDWGRNKGEHGTAVLGILVGQHNGFGINGISPNAQIGISATNPDDNSDIATAKAIDSAVNLLKPGDIIVIERFMYGLDNSNYNRNCETLMYNGWVPEEFSIDCFDAISRATSKGIIVVEPAGNGGVNLDDTIYHDIFNRKFRNSGAIMVAADGGGDRIPVCISNSGSRIDFFAWGKSIVSCGYGDLFKAENNEHKDYTAFFGGTSGATAIIAGVIANLQGIQINLGKAPLTGEQIRELVKGSAKVSGSAKIGIMPDLKATIDALLKHN